MRPNKIYLLSLLSVFCVCALLLSDCGGGGSATAPQLTITNSSGDELKVIHQTQSGKIQDSTAWSILAPGAGRQVDSKAPGTYLWIQDEKNNHLSTTFVPAEQSTVELKPLFKDDKQRDRRMVTIGTTNTTLLGVTADSYSYGGWCDAGNSSASSDLYFACNFYDGFGFGGTGFGNQQPIIWGTLVSSQPITDYYNKNCRFGGGGFLYFAVGFTGCNGGLPDLHFQGGGFAAGAVDGTGIWEASKSKANATTVQGGKK